MVMVKVRCGLIGYGAWGRHHARAIASVEGARLAAICARSAESSAQARADYPEAHVYSDYREMLAREELDLCDVVLPSDLHFAVARDVLESRPAPAARKADGADARGLLGARRAGRGARADPGDRARAADVVALGAR